MRKDWIPGASAAALNCGGSPSKPTTHTRQPAAPGELREGERGSACVRESKGKTRAYV